jgi:hypothetical protein
VGNSPTVCPSKKILGKIKSEKEKENYKAA